MALIKKSETETATETATVNDVQETETMTETAAEKKEVAQVKSNAVAVPSTGSFWMATAAILGIVDEADTQSYDRLVGSNGQLKLYSTNKPIGTWVKFRAIAEKRKRSVSPNGAPGDTEAKNFFAAAYDNQLSSRGNDIEEDLEIAKAAGYDKAKIAEYIDLFVLIEETEKDDADLVGEIVVIQLAQVAKGTWISFKSGLLMKNELGMLKFDDGKPPLIEAVAKSDTNKAKQDYTTIKFKLA